MTYTSGYPGPANGFQRARTVTVWLDGQLNVQRQSFLNVARNDVWAIGSYISMTAGLQVATSGLSIGAIRLHEGALTPDEIRYNYALDAAFYRGALGANVPAPPSPSPSASPGSAPSPSACPTAWGVANTHFLRLVSISSAAAPTSYARHCGFWVFMRPNFPVTDAVASGDATQIVRLGVDGSSGSYSFQSANFPEQYLTPAGADGYLYFDAFYSTIQGTSTRRASWDLLQQPDGSFIMASHAAAYNNVTVGVITYATAHGCGDNGNTNMRADNALAPLKINLVDALWSANS
jgi:hypothetical protein